MWSFFPTDQILFPSVNTAPNMGAPNVGAPSTGAPSTGPPNAAAAAKVKELISSFLKKTRVELLQCKTQNIALFKDELSVLIAQVPCDFVVT